MASFASIMRLSRVAPPVWRLSLGRRGPISRNFPLFSSSSRPHAPTAFRTFFSYRSTHHHPGPRFTPLEDFVLDVSAWMVALSLWYIPRMEFDEDQIDDGNGDNQDSHLEYREDYGPTLSSYGTNENEDERQTRKKKNNPTKS